MTQLGGTVGLTSHQMQQAFEQEVHTLYRIELKHSSSLVAHIESHRRPMETHARPETAPVRQSSVGVASASLPTPPSIPAAPFRRQAVSRLCSFDRRLGHRCDGLSSDATRRVEDLPYDILRSACALHFDFRRNAVAQFTQSSFGPPLFAKTIACNFYFFEQSHAPPATNFSVSVETTTYALQ